MPNLQTDFGESRICTPKPQLAMCTACLKRFSFLNGKGGGDGKKRQTNYNLSPVQIVIIKGHHMTQHTDGFPTVQTFLVSEELRKEGKLPGLLL
jgi:hypothetical protein